MARENLYEMVVIFDAQGEEAEIKREFDLVRSLIENRSSEFLGQANWGLRNFAYPIKKRMSGYYVYYLFKAGIEVPAMLSETLKMDEKVLRYLIVRAKSNAREYLNKLQEQQAEAAVAAESVGEEGAATVEEPVEAAREVPEGEVIAAEAGAEEPESAMVEDEQGEQETAEDEVVGETSEERTEPKVQDEGSAHLERAFEKVPRR